MADTTVVANPGAGGSSFKVDADVGGALHPYSKMEWGPSGTQNEVDDATGKRVPVKVGEVAVTVPVDSQGRAAVFHGQATAGTVEGALAANACKEVTLKNLQGNAAVVWIGITAVAAGTGYELMPGEAITLKVSNTNLIHVLSPSGNQTVCFIGTN